MKKFNIDERINICKKCPIFVNGRCSSNLWINPDTDEISKTSKAGYIRGCNCMISIKAQNSNNHCIAGKW